MQLSERLARLLEHADHARIARDLEVIRLQLARAEGKLARLLGSELDERAPEPDR